MKNLRLSISRIARLTLPIALTLAALVPGTFAQGTAPRLAVARPDARSVRLSWSSSSTAWALAPTASLAGPPHRPS